MAFVVLDFFRLAFFSDSSRSKFVQLGCSRLVPSPRRLFSVPSQQKTLSPPSMNAKLAIGARSQQSDQTNPYSSFKRAQGQADACHDGVPGALLLLGIHQVETVNGTAAPFRKVATAV